MPHGRVCFVRGESPVSFFAKLFGKGRRGGDSGTARHRAPQGPDAGRPEDGTDRPLFRDEVAGSGGGNSGGHGPVSVDPGTQGRIGSQAPPTSESGGGSALPVCNRCGARVAEASRFCSNCGAPLRGGAPAEGASETTSTISISGLEAYDSESTGQHASPVLPPEAQSAVDALPMGSALLIVRRGPNSGSRFLLDGDLTTAGRHPESDIFLDDVTVSRRHVEFRRGSDGVFTVADVGSLNGTYVNRERIETAVPLGNGDEVQIGKYRLVFYASQHAV
ncbi:FHA domain-containing protein [Streptomyces sp. WMMB303]|nr:FHA domain-containing protein [Streptomyces sp. WMMB303]MDF4249260.1 FHA domain-containing protein [Streptomyces sp. WMMB303]